MKIAIYNNSKIYDKEINSMILFFQLDNYGKNKTFIKWKHKI